MRIHFENICYNDRTILVEKDSENVYVQRRHSSSNLQYRMDEGQAGFRTDQMQDRKDARQDGCMTGWMQDKTDAGHDICRT